MALLALGGALFTAFEAALGASATSVLGAIGGALGLGGGAAAAGGTALTVAGAATTAATAAGTAATVAGGIAGVVKGVEAITKVAKVAKKVVDVGSGFVEGGLTVKKVIDNFLPEQEGRKLQEILPPKVFDQAIDLETFRKLSGKKNNTERFKAVVDWAAKTTPSPQLTKMKNKLIDKVIENVTDSDDAKDILAAARTVGKYIPDSMKDNMMNELQRSSKFRKINDMWERVPSNIRDGLDDTLGQIGRGVMYDRDVIDRVNANQEALEYFVDRARNTMRQSRLGQDAEQFYNRMPPEFQRAFNTLPDYAYEQFRQTGRMPGSFDDMWSNYISPDMQQLPERAAIYGLNKGMQQAKNSKFGQALQNTWEQTADLRRDIYLNSPELINAVRSHPLVAPMKRDLNDVYSAYRSTISPFTGNRISIPHVFAQG